MEPITLGLAVLGGLLALLPISQAQYLRRLKRRRARLAELAEKLGGRLLPDQALRGPTLEFSLEGSEEGARLRFDSESGFASWHAPLRAGARPWRLTASPRRDAAQDQEDAGEELRLGSEPFYARFRVVSDDPVRAGLYLSKADVTEALAALLPLDSPRSPLALKVRGRSFRVGDVPISNDEQLLAFLRVACALYRRLPEDLAYPLSIELG